MDTTLKPLAAQYDERLRVMFQEWFAELGKKDYSVLLEQAFDIFTEMNNYIHAAFRPDEEKAVKLQDDDLDYEMPFRGCLDFNPDSYELREVIASIYTGRFVQKRYPVLSDEYDTTEMMRELLQNRLLEKLQEEY